MKDDYIRDLQKRLNELQSLGFSKEERVIVSPQQSHIQLADERNVINLCSNNYLGLANHPDLIEAAKKSLETYGFGMASVRFICGTQSIHQELEKRLSEFLKTEETILYSSCFDANGGLFETLLEEQDAVISDSLNHASIIDGIRLSKAKRFRYANNNMDDLETQLKAAVSCRYKLIATDGVFSMDGTIANLRAICDLADQYDALVLVDDSHAVGFMGINGRGTPEFCGVEGRIDILTGTLGKALGGASGGYVSGKRELIQWLRQRSRPYLFSNTLAPSIVGASLAMLELLKKSAVLRDKVHENSIYFRQEMNKLDLELIPGSHPIIPIMLKDASLTKKFAAEMLKEGIYVVGFSYPVVPQDQARIRTQISALHSKDDLNQAVAAFSKIRNKLMR